MKRVAENRHYSILLGFAFLGAYRKERLRGVRKALGEKVWRQRKMEVAFNEGRAWHFLGLGHLAVPRYWRCLALAEEGGGSGSQGVDMSPNADDDDDDDDDEGAGADVNNDTTMQDVADPESPPEQPEIPDEATLRNEPDYSREAALSLQHMMALAGNMAEARRIGEQYLVY